jgi:lipid-binding SYLF domain-containing protein
MKNYRNTSLVVAAIAMIALVAAPLVAEDTGDWRSMKRDAKRAKIDEMASEALATLFKENPQAKELMDSAHGWAVFDNLKIALGVSGGGGNGVAVDAGAEKRTYMKMGTVGVGLGLGGKKYQVVVLFQDETTIANFVEKGWQADASASAVAGTEGAGGQTGFVNGMAIYMITDKGLMASADVSGTKYWKDSKLN